MRNDTMLEIRMNRNVIFSRKVNQNPMWQYSSIAES